MNAPVAKTGPLMWILGVILPVVVLTAGYVRLQTPPELSPQAAQIDTKLAESNPRVVVLGSSLANRGVDLAVLSRELGIAEERIVVLQLPHAAVAHWYAILKNRVYAGGYEPDLVLVVGALTTMLNHDLMELQPNVERLVQQLTDDEPVIGEKVFGFTSPEQFRVHFMRERASAYRSQILDGFRDRVVTWLFSKKGHLEEGQRIAEKVNEEVFANANMDYGLHTTRPTGLGSPPSDAFPTTDPAAFDLRRDGLVADMAELVHAHDAELVWVRYPFPPSNREMDVVPEAIEREAIAWMESTGAGYLDMRALDLDDSQYEDMRHMTRQGSERFTGAVGKVLAAMDAMGEGRGVRVVRGMAPPSEVAVGGDPVAVPALAPVPGTDCRHDGDAGPWAVLDGALLRRFGGVEAPLRVTAGGEALAWGPGGSCSGHAWIEDGRLIAETPTPGEAVEVSFLAEPDPEGDAVRWLVPGSTVTFTFDEPWRAPPITFRVFLRGLLAGGQVVPMTVAVGDQTFHAEQRHGRLAVEQRLDPPEGSPWTLSLQVPEDGPFVMLHHLAIGAAPTTTYVYGGAETLHGASVRLVGGRLDDVAVTPTFLTDPPPFPHQPPVRKAPRNTGQFSLPKFKHLADAPGKDVSRPNKCSPVRILEDGQVLKGNHAVCYDVITKGSGRSCFAAGTLYFASSDDTDPTTNGREYTLALSPHRGCETYAQRGAATLRGNWWLYPGDVARIPVPAERAAEFRDGAAEVELEVIPHMAAFEVPLQVRVTMAGETVFEDTWSPVGTLAPRRHRFPIRPVLPARARDLVIEVSNPSKKSFALMSMLSLSEEQDLFAVGSVPTAAAEAERFLPMVAHREGTPADPGVPTFSETSPSGAHEAKLFGVWAVSDSVLVREGRGPISPLRMFADGTELTHLRDRKTIRTGCTACFSHIGQALVYRAPGGPTADLSLGWDPRFPIPTDKGRELWWVLPGTRAVLEVEESWSSAPALLTVDAFAYHPKRTERGRGVFLTVDGERVPFLPSDAGEGAVRAVVELPAPPEDGGGFTLEVFSEAPQQALLLAGVRVTEPDGEAWILPREGVAGAGEEDPLADGSGGDGPVEE